MSFVVAAPEAVAAAASELNRIGSAIAAAAAAATQPTTVVATAAADEISEAVATLFADHAQEFQKVCSRVAASHDDFVAALHRHALSYAQTEVHAARNLGVSASIENFYNSAEPWVRYGVYAFNDFLYHIPGMTTTGYQTAGPFTLISPQFDFLYDLYQPVVKGVLFNTIDVLDGTITASQGLDNLWSAANGSVSQFLWNEQNWAATGFPAPPLPPQPWG